MFNETVKYRFETVAEADVYRRITPGGLYGENRVYLMEVREEHEWYSLYRHIPFEIWYAQRCENKMGV